MDDILLLIVYIVIVVIVEICVLVYFVNDHIYPSLNKYAGNGFAAFLDGIAGNPGAAGNNGATGTFATPGITGPNGATADPGLTGNRGSQGVDGAAGSIGDAGFAGIHGEVGLSGLPSNSTTAIVNHFKMTRVDSYTLQDVFSYEDKEYAVSMYMNIDNNSRFILKPGEILAVGPGSGNTGATALGFTALADPGATALSLGDLEGGYFFSNLRIIIEHGRGNADSKKRSDDVVFYVSPIISRRTMLFKYKLPLVIDPMFGRLDINYPVTPIGNTKEFFYFPTKLDPNAAITPSSTIDKFHLLGGLAKYEIVVNTFPPLPSNVKFNYRIVEYFTRNDDFITAVPQAVFPFNSVGLTYKNGDTADPKDTSASMTVSNRFDLNKVISRDFTTELQWIQTNKKLVEIVIPHAAFIANFENTYHLLEEENDVSASSLSSLYFETGGETLIVTAELDLSLENLDNSYDNILRRVTFVMRRYIPPVPLSKFDHLQKFYMKFRMQLVKIYINFETDSIRYFEPQPEYSIIEYGKNYSFDLLDFKTLYSKLIGMALYYNAEPTAYQPYRYDDLTSGSALYGQNTLYNPFPTVSYTEIFVWKLDVGYPITVGYTTYKDHHRYSCTVLPQPFNGGIVGYFINIPLYGYKKE
jgi:hypothetical protein